MRALGADGMNVLRGVEDNKAYEKGLNNSTTARGLGVLLEAIAKGIAVDAESCKEMVVILERQKFNEGIPAGLPAGIQAAHKTGEITKIHHDAAIVFAGRPFDNSGARLRGEKGQLGADGGHQPECLRGHTIECNLHNLIEFAVHLR